jgi:hypothetical protein
MPSIMGPLVQSGCLHRCFHEAGIAACVLALVPGPNPSWQVHTVILCANYGTDAEYQVIIDTGVTLVKCYI